MILCRVSKCHDSLQGQLLTVIKLNPVPLEQHTQKQRTAYGPIKTNCLKTNCLVTLSQKPTSEISYLICNFQRVGIVGGDGMGSNREDALIPRIQTGVSSSSRHRETLLNHANPVKSYAQVIIRKRIRNFLC